MKLSNLAPQTNVVRPVAIAKPRMQIDPDMTIINTKSL